MLLDLHGEIGRVSMSVILVPFPKAELAKAVPAADQARDGLNSCYWLISSLSAALSRA